MGKAAERPWAVKEIETKQESKTEFTLSAEEAHRLIGICVELVALCARATGKLDPAIGTMIGFARDEALSDALGFRF